MEPASIRYNNPGAMWGGSALAKKWGATKTVGLNDGLGQGNNIAVFPTKVRGAAAQFDLWHTSGYYHNKTLLAAITKWSGGNWVPSYTKFLRDRVPGLTNSTVMSDAYMASEDGIKFVKAQAWHEAGKPYPMSDAEWREAQKLVHGKNAVKPLPPVVKKAGPVASGGAATQQALENGFSWGKAIFIGIAVCVIAFVVVKVHEHFQQKKLDKQITEAEIALEAARKAAEASKAPEATPVAQNPEASQ